MRIQGKEIKDVLTNIRKFVRKRAYLTILDKHPSAIFWPFFHFGYLEIGWLGDQCLFRHFELASYKYQGKKDTAFMFN